MRMTVNEIIKRRIVQQWLSREARDNIAIDNNIGSCTVSTVVDDIKPGLIIRS